MRPQTPHPCQAYCLSTGRTQAQYVCIPGGLFAGRRTDVLLYGLSEPTLMPVRFRISAFVRLEAEMNIVFQLMRAILSA
jgi:hypothetical protein